MPIRERGWEMLVTRTVVQVDAETGRTRTVGRYQVFHDGVAQHGAGLSGTAAEAGGPGANRPEGNGRRIAAGRYPVRTWGGEAYVTWGHAPSSDGEAGPQPGFELGDTGERTEILVHPGRDFLASTGCINLCDALPGPHVSIDYPASRLRVIAVIDDMKRALGQAFPRANGCAVPGAFVILEGEP